MNSALHIDSRDSHFIRKAGARLIALFVALVFAISLPVSGTGAARAGTGTGHSDHAGMTPGTMPDVNEVLPFAESDRELDHSRFDTFPVIQSAPVQPVALGNDVALPECIAPGGFYLNPAARLPFCRGPPALS
jgi:hypothetical protein